jgi:hypothetical protein
MDSGHEAFDVTVRAEIRECWAKSSLSLASDGFFAALGAGPSRLEAIAGL